MLGFFDVEQLNDNAVRLTFLGWGTRSATSASPGCGRTRPCTNLFVRFAPSWFPTTKNICAWKSIPACMLLFCNFLCGVYAYVLRVGACKQYIQYSAHETPSLDNKQNHCTTLLIQLVFCDHFASIVFFTPCLACSYRVSALACTAHTKASQGAERMHDKLLRDTA